VTYRVLLTKKVKVSKTWIYIQCSTYRFNKTFNVLVTLAKAEQDCLEELFKTVRTTHPLDL